MNLMCLYLYPGHSASTVALAIMCLHVTHRPMKVPVKRTKGARSWEGGSLSKQDLESLDCSDQTAASSIATGSLNGDSLNVDVS